MHPEDCHYQLARAIVEHLRAGDNFHTGRQMQ